MCGIAGSMARPGGSGPPVDAMIDLLRHRGPDDRGLYTDGRGLVALGHCRLSIIDLSAASHEPMVDDETGVVLVYNGELYNFVPLRRQLAGQGHVFRSRGDAEVVLRSYLQWGPSCVERFAGMFAFAIWDPRSATLHLARDAMGMKPVYFHAGDQAFAFASELKAFKAWPGFSAALDTRALGQYLEFGYVFDERRTMVQGVEKLPPGWRLEVREGRIAHAGPWFEPPSPAATPDDEGTRIEELGALMEVVVREHLVADVPLGLLLSGGLDSSLLAALAAREAPLLTMTMGFGASTVDERAQAREVAGFIGSRHVEVEINPADVKAEAMSGAWVFDDLFADWGTITTRLLYRRCREQGIKVVLVGEGADELFGGYDIFNVPDRLSLWGRHALYRRYAGRRWGRLFWPFRTVLDEYLRASAGDAFGAVRLFESRRQLPNQYVMKVDKASMAESVEARAPYLDRRIAEFAYRTPRKWLQRGGENKYVLRALARARALLPPAASSRPKFGAPLAASWMDDDPAFRAFAREQILCARSQTHALGLDGAMRAYYDEGRSGYRFPASLSIFSNLAWRLLLLELWSKHYLARA